MSAAPAGRRLTRQDVEQAFAKVLGETDEASKKAMPQALVAAGAVVVAAVALAYLGGKRRGRRKAARIEIRQL